MKTRFTLVNPKISGEQVQTSVVSSNPYKAGRKLYGGMAKYFTNRLQRFYITVKDDDDHLYHMRIEEKEDSNRAGIKTTFTPLQGDGDQMGGGSKLADELEMIRALFEDDDDDSDSDSDDSDGDYSTFVSSGPNFYLPLRNFIYYDLPYYELDRQARQIYNWTMPNFYHRAVPRIQVRRRLIPI